MGTKPNLWCKVCHMLILGCGIENSPVKTNSIGGLVTISQKRSKLKTNRRNLGF